MRKSSPGVALLALVAIVHYGYDPLAQALYPGVKNAPAAIFYVLRGFEGIAVYALLWRYMPRAIPVVIACMWGILENVEASICRLAAGIGGASPGYYSGLCDAVSGLPISAFNAIAVLVALAVVQESEK